MVSLPEHFYYYGIRYDMYHTDRLYDGSREPIQLAAAFVLALGWDQEQEQDMNNGAKQDRKSVV